jgi:hypothetical protein
LSRKTCEAQSQLGKIIRCVRVVEVFCGCGSGGTCTGETYPDDTAVRDRLTSSLLNTLIFAKAEGDLARRDTLLDELRDLARTFPDDAAVRGQLARSLLLNRLIDASNDAAVLELLLAL